MQPEQQQRIMGYFIEEAKDHLNTLEQGLLNLQSTIEDPEMVNEMFRAAHSVKGGAAMLGLNSIQRVGHRLEDFFKVLKESPVRVDQKLETLLLQVFDALQELLGQLQGPFGLTDDVASATVAGVEPVFEELEQHLRSLTSGLTIPPQSIPTPAIAQSAIPEPLPAKVTQPDSALSLIFGSDVPTRLRDMLQLFKQVETAITRQQLQDICHNLASIGEQFDLSAWCDLLDTAEQAIANPDHAYRILAPIIIKDIKQAQELVLAGRAEEIMPCAQLQALLPSLAAVDESAELEDLLAPSDIADVIFTEEPDIAASRESMLAAIADTDNSAEFQMDEEFSDASVRELSEHDGPEVGMSELNTLADLFEGEVPDLGATWQEEEILGNAANSLTTGADDFTANGDDNFITDLLFEDPRTTTQRSQSIAGDALSDLFDDEILESGSPEFALPEVTEFPRSTNGGSLGDDLDDLLSVSEASLEPTNDRELVLTDQIADTTPLDIDIAFGDLNFDDQFNAEPLTSNGLNLEEMASSGTTLDNLGELFAGMDEQDLDLADFQSVLGDVSQSFDLDDLENPLADPFSQASAELAASDAELVVADPWTEPESLRIEVRSEPESFQNSTSQFPTELPDVMAENDVDLTNLFDDANLLAVSLEELSEPDELDFSELFDPIATQTNPEDPQPALPLDELIESDLDLSDASWLSESFDLGISEVQTGADLSDLELSSDILDVENTSAPALDQAIAAEPLDVLLDLDSLDITDWSDSLDPSVGEPSTASDESEPLDFSLDESTGIEELVDAIAQPDDSLAEFLFPTESLPQEDFDLDELNFDDILTDLPVSDAASDLELNPNEPSFSHDLGMDINPADESMSNLGTLLNQTDSDTVFQQAVPLEAADQSEISNLQLDEIPADELDQFFAEEFSITDSPDEILSDSLEDTTGIGAIDLETDSVTPIHPSEASPSDIELMFTDELPPAWAESFDELWVTDSQPTDSPGSMGDLLDASIPIELESIQATEFDIDLRDSLFEPIELAESDRGSQFASDSDSEPLEINDNLFELSDLLDHADLETDETLAPSNLPVDLDRYDRADTENLLVSEANTLDFGEDLLLDFGDEEPGSSNAEFSLDFGDTALEELELEQSFGNWTEDVELSTPISTDAP